jgi:hypothetical protein
MKMTLATAVLITPLLLANVANAQNKYYLPQIANGDYGSGRYKMTFVLFNQTDTDTTANLDLTDDSGIPLVMTVDGTTASSFAIQLAAGASRLLQTDGQGSVVVGAATVTCATDIGVSAIFSIYDANGNYLTETGVGNSEALTSFVLPVDTTGLFNTGVALFNINGGSVTYTMTLRDTNGQQVGTQVQDQLEGLHHVARFVSGTGQLFPSVSNFQGTLTVQCSSPVAAMVLRQNSTPLSFTSLPTVSTGSTKSTLNLAHIANGSFGSGSYKMSFLIFNISSSTANVSLTLTDDDGLPLNLSIVGHGNQSRFDFSGLAPGASLFLQTDGAGSVVTGGATITSNTPIGASGIFTVLNSQGGFQTETGVGDSPVLTSLTLPVDITGSFNTGVAFLGVGASGPTLTFRLLDSDGNSVGSSTTRTLAAKGHLAVFVSQLFPGTSGFRGSLAVTSTAGVAALTLRENDQPLSFTTLPVVSGTSSGKTPSPSGTALLWKTESGVTATSNVVKNVTLPSGFKLTGKVTGPGVARTVFASLGQTLSYSGSVNSQTGSYLVILPAGTYNISVGFTPNGVPSDQELSMSVQVASGVQISGDTSRDLTLPPVTLYQVSGVVTNLSNLPLAYVSGPANILMDDSGNPPKTAQFTVDMTTGSYQGVLPAGTYSQGFNASFSTSGLQFQSLGLLTVATVSISGDTVIPPYAVPPTATLSGTVQGSSSPFGGTTLTATNAPATVVGTSVADMMTNQYQMFLAKNILYGVTVGVPLVEGYSVLGSMTFPLPAASLTLNQDTANFNFTVPPNPPLVTISGRVTDSGGSGVANVSISASSDSITGGQFSMFAGYGQTDAGGNYSMTVFSGTNYQIYYLPTNSGQ